jgi:hypothetical protein
MGKGITKEPVLACRRRCSSRAVEGQGRTWAEIPNRILSWAISIESIVNIPIFACEIVWDERPPESIDKRLSLLEHANA